MGYIVFSLVGGLTLLSLGTAVLTARIMQQRPHLTPEDALIAFFLVVAGAVFISLAVAGFRDE